MFGYIDHLNVRGIFPLSLLGRPLLSLPASRSRWRIGIGVPPVVTDQLEVLVGDMPGDGGDEVGGAEDFEPTEGRRADAKRRQ